MTETADALTLNGHGHWQRLPKPAIVTMYFNTIQKLVRENLFLFFGAGTGFALSDWFGLRELMLMGGGLLLAGLLVAIVYHRRFQYRVDDNSIRVRQGFIERKELKVPFERVQTTGMSQPLYMKPLGLTRFSLQTPGAAITEVVLPGLPVDEAMALRDRIAAIQFTGEYVADGAAIVEPVEIAERANESPAQMLYQAQALDLFLYGLTSNQIWIMLGFLIGPLLGFYDDRIGDYVDWVQSLALFQALSLYDSPLLIVLVILSLLITVGVLLMVLSGLLSMVRFYGYQLTLQSEGTTNEGFKSQFGLLDQREKTLKKIKLHSLETVQTALGRALGRWHLVGHQTGMNVTTGPDLKFLVPGVADSLLEPLAHSIDSIELDSSARWQPIDPMLRRILMVRTSLPMMAIALFLQWVDTDHAQQMDAVSGIILLINLLVIGLIHLRCKRWGFMLRRDTVLIRQGLIGQSIMRFRLISCQQVRVKQSPLQRRKALATLYLRLPHGEVQIPWIELEQARELANRGLYQVETMQRHAL
ncbi:MAG: PH domain-containing protein [Pseudomonadota bacterium]